MKRIMLLIAFLFVFQGCACKKPDPVVAGRIVIDCLAQNQGDLGALRAELLPLIMTGDWTAFEAKAKSAGIDVGGCVAAELINRYLAPAPGNAAPPPEQGRLARETMDRLRAGWNGATFKTDQGVL